MHLSIVKSIEHFSEHCNALVTNFLTKFEAKSRLTPEHQWLKRNSGSHLLHKGQVEFLSEIMSTPKMHRDTLYRRASFTNGNNFINWNAVNCVSSSEKHCINF